MGNKPVQRRLAAILAADVAGYTRLMELDTDGTVTAWQAAREEVIGPEVANHSGNIVKLTGDGFLVEFSTVQDAVECAIAMQCSLVPGNLDFRMGVNLGDIVDDGEDIHGEGVNVAARLEGLADPGGICVSGDVYNQVRNRVDAKFEDMGRREVKNVSAPVQVYAVRFEGFIKAPMPAVAAISDLPSVAVLPFDNLSGDLEQEYFADGVAEDLITELSRLRWLLVTSRNSTFTYKGQAVDVKQVGQDLGARYIVGGSVRKGGERVRITAQLVDTATGNHIWAERYDRDLSNIFTLQDEITETLVAAFQVEVGEFERKRAHRKPPESLDAWELYQRGMWHLWRINAKDLAEARRLFQRAADLDNRFAQAVAALGYTLYLEVSSSQTDTPIENLERALGFANQAVALDDKESMAHFTLGRVQTSLGEYDAAIAELRTAIDLNSSLALAHMGLGVALTLIEQFDEAISEFDAALRLSPRDPFVWVFYAYRALARLLLLDYEAAVEDARRAIRHPAANDRPHTLLASALAHLDKREEAKIALDKLLEIKPDFTPDEVLAAYSPLNPEALRPLFETWVDGLRKAGLNITDEPPATD